MGESRPCDKVTDLIVSFFGWKFCEYFCHTIVHSFGLFFGCRRRANNRFRRGAPDELFTRCRNKVQN